jgi:hypothetical protein
LSLGFGLQLGLRLHGLSATQLQLLAHETQIHETRPVVRASADTLARNRCLSDSDPECILCARQHSVIREIRRNQTSLADRHDLFLSEVREAEDGFGVVAGAFGRGLMGKKVES